MELVVLAPIDISDAVERALRSFPRSESVQVAFAMTTWGSRGASRNQGFAMARGKWVYFLDQDTCLERTDLFQFARRLLELDELAQPPWLASGFYLSQRQASFWGRRYNWLTNQWLRHSAEGTRFLAGNVLFLKEHFVPGPYVDRLTDGGEEIELSGRIVKQGGSIVLTSDLSVVHCSRHTFLSFLSRLRTHLAFKRYCGLRAAQSSLSPTLLLLLLLRNPVECAGVLVQCLALGLTLLRKDHRRGCE